MKRQELMDLLAQAYELQETLKRERQQIKKHDEEYKDLMAKIIRSNVRQLGKYEVRDMEVQHQHFIISDKFRERWPDLFNKLATVKLKDAREIFTDKDLEAVWELKTVIKHVIVVRNKLKS